MFVYFLVEERTLCFRFLYVTFFLIWHLIYCFTCHIHLLNMISKTICLPLHLALNNRVIYFFFSMKECGFSPSVVSYGCLINLYTKVRHFIFNLLFGHLCYLVHLPLSAVTAWLSCKFRFLANI
jgi:hypothetical protein